MWFLNLVGLTLKPVFINMTVIFKILTITKEKNEVEPILELMRNLLHETMPGGCFPTEFTHMKQDIDRPKSKTSRFLGTADPSNSVDMFIDLDGKARNN
jgi:hypothetical protein